MAGNNTYDAGSISVLEGLEAPSVENVPASVQAKFKLDDAHLRLAIARLKLAAYIYIYYTAICFIILYSIVFSPA